MDCSFVLAYASHLRCPGSTSRLKVDAALGWMLDVHLPAKLPFASRLGALYLADDFTRIPRRLDWGASEGGRAPRWPRTGDRRSAPMVPKSVERAIEGRKKVGSMRGQQRYRLDTGRWFRRPAVSGKRLVGLVGVLTLIIGSCADKPAGEVKTGNRTSRVATSAPADLEAPSPIGVAAGDPPQESKSTASSSGDAATDVTETGESSVAAPEKVNESSDAEAAAATKAKPPAGEESPENASADTRSTGEYPLQDNPLAGCSLCHVDVEDEFLGSKHFEEKVGCRTCHGPSEGHVADENNDVKPDEVFAREDVDQLCVFCHECSRPDKSKPVKTADGTPKVCIECHGQHNLALAQ